MVGGALPLVRFILLDRGAVPESSDMKMSQRQRPGGIAGAAVAIDDAAGSKAVRAGQPASAVQPAAGSKPVAGQPAAGGKSAVAGQPAAAGQSATAGQPDTVSSATALAGSGAAVADGSVGLGVDIVEIERMRKILKRSPAFARKVFSGEERSYCDATAAPEIHYATRFAAKEAVLKALGTGFSEGIGVRDIEVRRTSKGRPYAVLSGRAREIAKEMGVRELPLSLSYTHAEAVACAMAITDGSVRAQESRRDPMEELSRQFKEARAMLDDLDGASSSSSTQVPSAMAAMDMVAASDGKARSGK